MARVNLYEELYDSLIEDRGIDAIWERATVCHCVSRDSGQPDFMCPTCGGSGYRYISSKKIRVTVTSLTGSFKMGTIELREPGTAYCTPKADIIMGYHDRLKFPSFQCIFSEVLHWDFDADGYGVSQKTYRNILGVQFLADDKYSYEEGIDYEVTEDRYHIRWLNKNHIDKIDKTNMSLLYLTTPSYIVVDLLHELRGTMSDRNSGGSETFRELPKQYKLQREDFIYKVNTPDPVQKDSDTDTETNNIQVTYDDDGGVTV